MIWGLFALLSGAGLALRNVLFKVASNEGDAPFIAMVLSITMATVATIFYVSERVIKNQQVFTTIDMKALIFAVMAGAALAFANIFLAYSYKSGGLASVVGIIQNGLAISLTLLIAVFLMGEHVKPQQIIGIIAAAVGIFLIIKT